MVHSKIHRILFVAAALTFTSPRVSAQSITAQIQEQLHQITAQNGQLIYVAVLSLPSIRKNFTHVMGKHSWLTYMPENLSDQLDDTKKAQIHSLLVQDLITMDSSRRKIILSQIQAWLGIYHTLALAEQLTSIEQVMAAVYASPESQSYFDQVISERKWKHYIAPAEIAASLTSGEIATIQYRLINDLTIRNPLKRIEYFQHLFKYLYQDYDNW